MTSQEVTSNSLPTSLNAISLGVHGHGAVSLYDPLDNLTHACYGLNEKCSSWTHVLNICAHSLVPCREDGEPAGGEDPLAESRLLGTHTPLKVQSGPWFLAHSLLPGWPRFEQAALHHMEKQSGWESIASTMAQWHQCATRTDKAFCPMLALCSISTQQHTMHYLLQ